jgi:hypothetical protein
LAARGSDLILIARRRDKLEEVAAGITARHQVAIEILEADLAGEDGLNRAAVRLENEPRLDLLVNNAGFGTLGRFWETDYARQEEMHRLHVTATLRLTRAALRPMLAANHGGIINVASVAGFFRSAGNISYCATKAWINAFTEGLYLELDQAGARVAVQSLCPGFTYSEFHDVLGVDRKALPQIWWMKAEDVVAESLKGLDHRKLFVIPGRGYRLLTAIGTRVPTSWRLYFQGKRSPHQRSRTPKE